jgi:molybdopterin-guanine dinucleotide biosynthesis protein A
LLLKNSALILAGGFSRRLGQDKGLIDLAGKPLILHVVDRVSKVVDETVVVVGSRVQKEKFESLSAHKANVVADKHEAQSPLVGALTGFESAKGEYSLLLPCDTPFISSQIAQFLLDTCVNKGAAIPRWPSGYIEPLQAAYQTKLALTAAKEALEQGKLDLRSMIARLREVRYISTVVLRQMDPKLLTFFNINTLGDLRRAESLLK